MTMRLPVDRQLASRKQPLERLAVELAIVFRGGRLARHEPPWKHDRCESAGAGGPCEVQQGVLAGAARADDKDEPAGPILAA